MKLQNTKQREQAREQVVQEARQLSDTFQDLCTVTPRKVDRESAFCDGRREIRNVGSVKEGERGRERTPCCRVQGACVCPQSEPSLATCNAS